MTRENIRNSNFNIHYWNTALITLCVIYGCFCAVVAELCHCNRGLQIRKDTVSHPLLYSLLFYLSRQGL